MSTNELLKRLQKLGVTKDVADTVNKSDFFSKKNIIDTGVPVMNLGLSGSFDGGLLPGITFVAGPKATFKTNMCLRMVSAYLKKYEDAICILYDTEFGITPEYLTQCGIDTTRVLHVPIGSVEQLKLDITPKLKEIKKGDHVIFMIDSVGNLPSEKEINDAEDGKIVGDMSRAKSLKSLFRIITSNLAIKDIPMIAINHVYAEIGCLAGDTVVRTTLGNKKIREVEIGDVVYTNNGTGKVYHTFTPLELNDPNKTYLSIEMDDGSIVECTDNHKFLMKAGEWKEAKDFIIGDEFY